MRRVHEIATVIVAMAGFCSAQNAPSGEQEMIRLLAQQIQELGLEEHVKLAGPQPQEELIELFGRATVFVLPCVVGENGDRDGLPTVLLEAMASGLPVVSTRLVGIPEIVEHGKSGLLVSPGNPDELCTAVLELLRNIGMREAVGRTGRARAERLFDLRENAPKLRQIFENSIAGRKLVPD